MVGLQRSGESQTGGATHARTDGRSDACAHRERKMVQRLLRLDRSYSCFAALEMAGADYVCLAVHEAWPNHVSLAGRASLHALWSAATLRPERCLPAA